MPSSKWNLIVLLLPSVSCTVIAVTVPVAGLATFEVRDLSGKGFSRCHVLRADYE